MKKAVIIGITGGLGKAIANEVLKEGYEVFGTYYLDSDKDTFLKVQSVKVCQMDMESRKSIDIFVEEMRKLGGIDFFINAAASPRLSGRFENVSIESIEKDFKINYFNFVYLLKKIFPFFNEKSNALFILSEMIDKPIKNYASYISVKYALLGLMKSLSLEYGNKIRINAISPTKMNTEYYWSVLIDGKLNTISKPIRDEQFKKGGFLNPETVAKKIISIIKDETIHGQNITIS